MNTEELATYENINIEVQSATNIFKNISLFLF